jgi:hypothetical protein
MQDATMTTAWVWPGADMMNAVTGEQLNTNILVVITAITGVTEENIIAIVTITEVAEGQEEKGMDIEK